jgi:hypothetical protein
MPMSPRLLRPIAAGGFNPKRLTGLVGWYDALDASTITTSTGVSQWRDKSGLSHHANQTTGGDQPLLTGNIDGKTVPSFNGTSQRLVITYAAAIGGLVDYSIFGVARDGASTNDFRAWWGQALTNANANRKYFIGANNGGAAIGAISSEGGTLSLTGVATRRSGVMADLYTLRRTSDAATFRQNGFLRATVNSPGTLTSTANLTIGSLVGTNFMWVGDVGEILVYNRGLSVTETATVEAYLSKKWGVDLVTS